LKCEIPECRLQAYVSVAGYQMRYCVPHRLEAWKKRKIMMGMEKLSRCNDHKQRWRTKMDELLEIMEC